MGNFTGRAKKFAHRSKGLGYFLKGHFLPFWVQGFLFFGQGTEPGLYVLSFPFAPCLLKETGEGPGAQATPSEEGEMGV